MSSEFAASEGFTAYSTEHAVNIMRILNQDRKEKKKLCDGMLQCNGREWSVHKCILGATSEFFEKLFFTEMREKRENVASVNNFIPDTWEKVLDFVYTGFPQITDDNVCALLECADYTQIPSLKGHCSQYLAKSVTPENSLELRAYARRYNLDVLEVTAIETIKKNYEIALQLESFNDLSVEDVVTIISMIPKWGSQKVKFNVIVRWVKHNLEKRQECFAKLFSLVDVELTSREFLNKTVKLEPLVCDSFDCMHRLLAPGQLDLVAKVSEILLITVGGMGYGMRSHVQSFNPEKHLDLPVMKCERYGATVVKNGHFVYVIGGNGFWGDCTVEKINMLEKKGWKIVSNMCEEREWAASALLNGVLYVSGGKARQFVRPYHFSCEKYDADLDRWTRVEHMLRGRGYHAMAAVNGLLYCVGGTDGADEGLLSAECYDRTTDTWRSIADMKKARWALAAVALNGHIYAIGGVSMAPHHRVNVMKSVERYDPETDAWTELQSLNAARCHHGACVSHGKIYVFGGSNYGREVTSVEVYDEASDKWENKFDMQSCPLGSTVIAF